ncbi:unnamed protein product [Linum trigynum]|uniref:Exopolyphosphatase n=1 Tax=Linum trigynum TaxID=586398 RepID=A0AAV2GA97_9ROSI
MALPDDLFAAIDMGTNSIKMIIVQFHPPSGRFLTVARHSDRVCLGRDSAAASSNSSPSISPDAVLEALRCLRQFTEILRARGVPPRRTRCVATSAVREAANGSELVEAVRAATGLDVSVLSGEEEARLAYSGVIQFFPVREKRALLIDIGGGSTEFAIGEGGIVNFATSLKLGHVSLTQRFAGGDVVGGMRNFIRAAVKDSGLVQQVKRFGFEVAVGSSGTIGAVEKAVFHGYGDAETDKSAEELLRRHVKRDWRFSRVELKRVVERLCTEEGQEEKEIREELFKKRSEFIVAGALLLEEIFELLGIEEMEVSEYALGEGVVAETLKEEFNEVGFKLNANPRWNSVVRLATRFNDKKRVKNGARCAAFAKGIFEGLRHCGKLIDLGGEDLGCLEAACLLHAIGLFAGKRGYHKQSYRVIMEGNHLYGFSTEEIKLIALLARHHTKKFPKPYQASLAETPEEFKKKLQGLCTIIRISVVLQKNERLNFQDMELSPLSGGFRLVLKHAGDQPISLSEEMKKDLRGELEHFKMVFKQQLSVDISSISEASKS